MKTLFSHNFPVVIGMVHLLPLPGSPRYAGSFEDVISRALADARRLEEGGVDAVMIENFGDVPFYADRVPPETTAAMAIAAARVRAAVGLPLGVNVLRNDALAALGIAAVIGAQAVRINVLSGAAVTDQGLIQGKAFAVLRRRQQLAPRVAILADVMVKHSAPLGDYPLEQAAKDVAYRGLADALIVSGSGTGAAVDHGELETVRRAVPDRPILLGSGVAAENIADYLPFADGFIVGTSLKKNAISDGPVSVARVRRFMKLVRAASGSRA